MDSKQHLIDLLTAHISLYHSRSSLPANPNSSPRSSILKWFSSLTVHQRQAHLTTVDPNFTQIVLQMQSRLRSDGLGCFIILPDIPSGDRPGLPSLCYRKSHGLLARVGESNEAERIIHESIRLFNSKEGEGVAECSCSANHIDSFTVSEALAGNVDEFVTTMDAVSNGMFLRGEESGLGSEWVELDWLKGRGYYSIEAFVANRLEVTLRLSWLSCNNGRKRAVRLKEKTSGAGVAANVFWRKKGCIDWWSCIDNATKMKVFQTALGKAAKFVTAEVLKETDGALKERMRFSSAGAENLMRCNISSNGRTFKMLEGTDAEFDMSLTRASVYGKASSFRNIVYGLCVLQDISNMLLACQCNEYDKERLFFSSLDCVTTVSDSILRKLRGLLMIISLDCTKFELLEEQIPIFSSKKCKEKVGATGRKKKGKTCNLKRANLISKSSKDSLSLDISNKDDGYGLANGKCADTFQSNRLADTPKVKDVGGKTFPAVEKECGGGLLNGVLQIASRKSKKGSKKSRQSGLNVAIEVGGCQTSNKTVTNASAISKTEAANDASKVNDKLGPNPSSCIKGPIQMDNLVHTIEGGPVVGSPDSSSDSCVKCCHSSDRKTENCVVTPKSENMNNVVDLFRILPVVASDGDGNCLDEIDREPVLSGRQVKGIIDQQMKIALTNDRESFGVCDTRAINSSEYISYEWPSVAPVHLPSLNSYLPAATDRLHLDVGYNWQNHFHRTFLQTVRQVRNPSIENACSGIVSRRVPMSLDWPPMVSSVSGLVPSVTCNYDSGFISRRQTSFQQSFAGQSVQHSTVTPEDEKLLSADFMELSDLANSQELADEHENHCVSEEEFEVHAISGMDYSQYFGGGVMYWNPSDHPATTFSRPPSLSSDDSSWAWREADINRAVDDMVAFSSSYGTNGLTSPSAASFCSPFDPLGQGLQALGYVIPGSEASGKVLQSASAISDMVTEESISGSLSSLPGDVEAKTGDPLPYPILRPIIIPSMSRERSRSDFKRHHDHKSPCVPANRREQPLIKRPPSPVVLCVPRAPCPPPPSPVADSRKHRGFPTVRSGSSSPRHWGVRGWLHDGINYEEACVCVDGCEVVWPSWRNKSLSACQLTQSLPGALLQDRLIAISQLARDQEHPDVAFPLQPPDLLNCPARKASLSLMHSLLHDEINFFCKQVASENLIRKPCINWAVKRVTRSLQVLWPRSRTNIFGSIATGLSLPTSDVDLVVCLPPVRNLEPIKEAGILEGRNGIKETCLQHAARYLANQEWVKNDSLKIVENTAIPIIMLVVEVPQDLIPSPASNLQSLKGKSIQVTSEEGNSFQTDIVGLESSALPMYSNMNSDSGKDTKSIRLDISFKSPSHTGLQTTELVKELTEQFPAATPLALVLKKFLADRSLDQSYSGGLSSYCLVVLIIRFLQHEHHHGRPINQNLGGLLMDFLYFFGNVFDPRQMRVSVQGSGVYINRERGYSIDPIYIDDPLFPTNNVGRNCFRIHQCIKAFADAYAILESELTFLPTSSDLSSSFPCKLLSKIIPSISLP